MGQPPAIVERGEHRMIKHDTTLTLFDVSSGRAVMVTCPDCGQLEVWSEQESNDHGLCRARGGACWCEAGSTRAAIREALLSEG